VPAKTTAAEVPAKTTATAEPPPKATTTTEPPVKTAAEEHEQVPAAEAIAGGGAQTESPAEEDAQTELDPGTTQAETKPVPAEPSSHAETEHPPKRAARSSRSGFESWRRRLRRSWRRRKFRMSRRGRTGKRRYKYLIEGIR
jgi:hypothetical protein